MSRYRQQHRVELRTYIATFLVGGGAASGIQAVEVGDPLDHVIGELGSPLASIRIDEVQIFYFEHGQVEVTRGAVSAANVLSAEQVVEQARQREEAAAAERKRRAEHNLRGKNELEQMLIDPAFLASPAAHRTARWASFKRAYPELPLPEDYYLALRERTLELEAQQTEQRIARLERRVREAEARADQLGAQSAVPYSTAGSGYVAASYGVVYPRTLVTVGSADRGCGVRSYRRYPYPDRYAATSPATARRAVGARSACVSRPATLSYGYQKPIGSPSSRFAGSSYRTSSLRSASFRSAPCTGVRGGGSALVGGYVR